MMVEMYDSWIVHTCSISVLPDLWGANGIRVRRSQLIQSLLHVSHRYHYTMGGSITRQATPTSSTHLQ